VFADVEAELLAGAIREVTLQAIIGPIALLSQSELRADSGSRALVSVTVTSNRTVAGWTGKYTLSAPDVRPQRAKDLTRRKRLS